MWSAGIASFLVVTAVFVAGPLREYITVNHQKREEIIQTADLQELGRETETWCSSLVKVAK